MDAAIPSWIRHALPGVALALLAGSAGAQQYPDETLEGPYADPEITTRIWFDRGDEPLLDRGDRVRLYYRTSVDAFVAVFNIDTNGTVRMLYPRSPVDDNWVRGGRDYRLLFPRSPYWYVDDQPGMGYFFVVASREPFDLSRFDYSYYGNGWDLTQVGRNVYRDPYVAMDDYVAALIPEWEYVPYALDFATYHVGQERYDYPRFLCYDCHGFRSYSAWNPYHYYCTSFRVVIYDDPWYYPSYRYGGRRVVYAGIPRARLPRYVFKERAAGEAGPPIVVTRANPTSIPGVAGDAARRIPSGIGSGGERPGVSPRTVQPGQGSDPGRRPGIPSDVGIPRRGDGSAVASPATPGGRGGSAGAPVGRGGEGRATPGSPAVRGRPDPGTPPAEGGRGGATGSTGRQSVPVIRPPSRPSERTRPVLERRPQTERRGGAGSSAGPARRPTGVLPPPTRPAPSARGGGTPTRPTPTARSGGTPTRSTPTVRSRSGGGGGSTPTARSGGTPTRPTPTARSGGTPTRSTPTVRPRSGGGGGSTPTARSGGVPSRPTPTARSGGTPTRSTPTVRPRSGGGGGSTPTVRSRSGGGSASTPTRPSAGARSRSGGSGASARTPTRVAPRSGGTSSARAPTSRSSGAPSRTRPPVRVTPRAGSSGGGSVGARPAPTRSRPSATRSSPPATPRQPVRVKRRGGGGGG